MIRLIKATIRNRRITIFAILMSFIFGLYSYYITPKQESPDISVTVALLTTVYPGASTQDVERLVTRKIEDKVMEVEGFQKVSSTSRNNLSVVVLELETGTDVDKAWNQLRQKMDELQSSLPAECNEIDINTDLYQTAGMIVSLSGQNYTYDELADFAEGLKGELLDVDGITRMEISGKQEMEVLVEMKTEHLNQLPISLEEITYAVRAQSMEIPAGALKDGSGKINVKTNGSFKNIQDIENVILLTSRENGSVVRLKDVADISFKLEESNYKIKHNDDNAVLLTGYFKGNRNIVLIGNEVDERISRFQQTLPQDVSFDKVLYQPQDVADAVNDFALNLLQGIIFVIIVVFISMGFRNAIIVSTSIPLSILLTFIGMRLLNIHIHQISIAALIIALGMLVDNAIVVSDAIQVRIDTGQEKMSACAEGAREVAVPVLASTLTTVGAFIPILLLSGMAGEFIRSIPQIVILSLSSSYVVALLVAPVMAYLFFKPTKGKVKKRGIRLFFEGLLKLALRRKGLTLAFLLPIIAVTVWLVSLLGLQFFPKADTDMIVIDIEHEQGNNITETEVIANQVTDILKNQEEVISYTAAIGDGLPKLYYSMAPPVRAQNYAQVMFKVDLEKGNRYKSNEAFGDFLQEVLDSEMTRGTASIKLLEQGEPIGAPVRIRVTGDREQTVQATERIKGILKSIEGTYNIKDNYSANTYDYRVNIDSDEALRMGVSKYDVQKELNIALMGQNAGYLNTYASGGPEGTQSRIQTPIRVTSDIENIDKMEIFAVKSSVTGQKVLLKQIAGTELQSGISQIQKYNRVPSITIYSDVRQGFSSVDIQRQVEERLSETELEDVRVAFDGERESIMKYFGNIGVLAILAVFVIFLVLLIQFSSFSQPFIIISTIPLSAVGSVMGLYLLGQPLSFTSLLGIVSLFGIVVNNAIVLVDFINTEKAMGKITEEACLDAVEKRFRPIMLTTLTTLVGLIPLMMSGSNLFTPMSISLASGLVISTFLTLVIIPVVYTIMDKGEKMTLR